MTMADKNGVTANNKHGGRPSIRTPENRRRILAVLQRGANFRTAAATAGVSEQAFKEWRREDEQFSSDCEQARAMAVVSPLDKVIEVMRNEPVERTRKGKKVMVRPYSEGEQMKMIRWFLEHRSEEFGPKRADAIANSTVQDAAKEIASIIESMDNNVLLRDSPVTSIAARRN